MELESKMEGKNAVMKDYGGGRIKRYGWEERVVVKCRGTREAATEWQSGNGGKEDGADEALYVCRVDIPLASGCHGSLPNLASFLL